MRAATNRRAWATWAHRLQSPWKKLPKTLELGTDPQLPMTPVQKMAANMPTMINVGAAATVVATVLTFWLASSQQADRISGDVDRVADRVDQVVTTVQGTRDAVMTLSGKVDGLAGSIDRNTHFLESLDERVRSLETERRDR